MLVLSKEPLCKLLFMFIEVICQFSIVVLLSFFFFFRLFSVFVRFCYGFHSIDKSFVFCFNKGFFA